MITETTHHAGRNSNKVLAPGSTIGILGGGQLGRMLAVAATRLGLNTHIYAPDANCPAALVAKSVTVGAFDDVEAVLAFAQTCDAVTYEFENVPAMSAKAAATAAPLRPGARALDVSQDRLVEKSFLRAQLGLAVAGFEDIASVHDLRRHILHTSTAPAQQDDGSAARMAGQILEHLDYVGVMGVEFFQMADGTLIVNEIAPRVHNSGHWTQDAGCTDQFEQHMRAVAGWPLGDARPQHGVVMINLIGEDVAQWKTLAAQPGTHLHLYGKSDIRPGRKMGHINQTQSGKI